MRISKNNIVSPIKEFCQSFYFQYLIAGISKIDDKNIQKVSDAIVERIINGKGIFAFGNGGSEIIAESFLLALEEKVSDKFHFNTFGNPKYSEAIFRGNKTLFNHKISRSASKDDLVILVSASGDSENINNASILCKKMQIETISISGYGRIANDQGSRSSYPFVNSEVDQQIHEDISLAILYIITEVVASKLNGKNEEVKSVKNRYLKKLQKGLVEFNFEKIADMAIGIVEGYEAGKMIRIDSPQNGFLCLQTQHMAHNITWDAFQGMEKKPSHKVYSGFLSCHNTGISNDGVESFQYTTELDDNFESGDIEVLFYNQRDIHVLNSIKYVVAEKKAKLFAFQFGDDFIGSNLAQVLLHIVGRTMNSYFLSTDSHDELGKFKYQLREDLAMLRKKNETQQKLRKKYSNGINESKTSDRVRIHLPT